MRLPSSRASVSGRLSWFDLAWVLAAPFIALALRDFDALTYGGAGAAWLFILCSVIVSLISLRMFRVRDGLTGFFSLHDGLEILKAGTFVAALTCTALFTVTRLDGVPRSLPLIHTLVLISGLLVARLVAQARMSSRTARNEPGRQDCEQVIIIGANRLASFYIGLAKRSPPGSCRVVGLLDERKGLVGRRISGIPILGLPGDLEAIVEELAVHGVDVGRVIVADADCQPGSGAHQALSVVCQQRAIGFVTLPELTGLPFATSRRGAPAAVAPDRSATSARPAYSLTKRVVDVAVSLTVLVVCMPLLAFVSLLVLFGIGSPVLFWQQRLGAGGQPFLLYKFRTLHAPFDSQGRPISSDRRLSTLGRLLRKLHVDELPQLYNVLMGDMSLVGPRPLLPIDQPADPTIRLCVRPGMTGWAQINGGKFLTAAEKNEFDKWYVRHASLRVDLRIILGTVRSILARSERGETWEHDAVKVPRHAQTSQGAPLSGGIGAPS